jgi:hypothetical protein
MIALSSFSSNDQSKIIFNKQRVMYTFQTLIIQKVKKGEEFQFFIVVVIVVNE